MRSTAVRRTIAAASILACSLGVGGCVSTVQSTLIRDEVHEWIEGKIVSMMLEDGTLIRFDAAGGFCVPKGSAENPHAAVVGVTLDKKSIEVDLQRVLTAVVEKSETDAAQTALLVLVGIPAAGLLLLILLLLIYSPH